MFCIVFTQNVAVSVRRNVLNVMNAANELRQFLDSDIRRAKKRLDAVERNNYDNW